MHFRQHIWHSRVTRPEAAATLVTSRQRAPMEEFNIVARHPTELLLSVVFCCPVALWVFTRTLSILNNSRCHFSSTPSFQYVTHKADCKVPGGHAHVCGEDVQQNSARRRRAVSSGCMWGRESFSGGVCPKGGKRVQPDRHAIFIAGVGVDMKLFSWCSELAQEPPFMLSSCGGAGQGLRHEKMSADRGVFGCTPPRGMRGCSMSCEEDRCAWHEMLPGFCHHERMKARRRWDNPPLLPPAVILA